MGIFYEIGESRQRAAIRSPQYELQASDFKGWQQVLAMSYMVSTTSDADMTTELARLVAIVNGVNFDSLPGDVGKAWETVAGVQMICYSGVGNPFAGTGDNTWVGTDGSGFFPTLYDVDALTDMTCPSPDALVLSTVFPQGATFQGVMSCVFTYNISTAFSLPRGCGASITRHSGQTLTKVKVRNCYGSLPPDYRNVLGTSAATLVTAPPTDIPDMPTSLNGQEYIGFGISLT